MAISMLKIRRPLGRLIFNMGIAIPGKTVFLIETAPWFVRYVITHTNFNNQIYFKVEHEWVIAYPLYYVDVIIYPCHNPDAGLIKM